MMSVNYLGFICSEFLIVVKGRIIILLAFVNHYYSHIVCMHIVVFFLYLTTVPSPSCHFALTFCVCTLCSSLILGLCCGPGLTVKAFFALLCASTHFYRQGKQYVIRLCLSIVLSVNLLSVIGMRGVRDKHPRAISPAL